MLDPKAAELAQAALEIATTLERGQAEQPLAERARKASDANSSLEIALLGLSAESKAAVVRFLVGSQHNSINVRLSESLGLVQIRLQERGYFLSSESQHSQEYAHAEQFESALDAALAQGGLAPESVRPVSLGLVAPAPLRNISLAVLPAPERVAQTPGVLSALGGPAALLAVAIPEDHKWREADAEAMLAVANGALALWPIIVGNSGRIPSDAGVVLAALRVPVLPPTPLRSQGKAPFLSLFPRDPLTRSAQHCRKLGRAAIPGGSWAC